MAWLNYEMDLLPARTVPLICMDLTDGVGLQQLPGIGWAKKQSPCIGEAAEQ